MHRNPDSRTFTRKGTFYPDEDSWADLMEETYTARGDLWRVAAW
ncbi:MAG: DUF1329 domain-containing protein [Rhodocyclaceae bacterium]|nr:DUF1329 domain-containing protein [Rhodocyclaceae bacterium]